MLDPDRHPRHIVTAFDLRNQFLFESYRNEVPRWRELTSAAPTLRFAPDPQLDQDLRLIWSCIAEVHLMSFLLPELPQGDRELLTPYHHESCAHVEEYLGFLQAYAAAHPELDINLEPFAVDWETAFYDTTP